MDGGIAVGTTQNLAAGVGIAIVVNPKFWVGEPLTSLRGSRGS